MVLEGSMERLSKEVIPVSVIIPCFNSENTIVRALNSVFSQTVYPIEVIIVDDCSSDGTLELLYDIQSHWGADMIKIISLRENSGPGKARNIAWEHAVGKYVSFLDSDDVWLESKLEIQYKFMRSKSNVVLSSHSSIEVSKYDEIKNLSCSYNHTPWSRLSLKSLLLRNTIPTRSVMVKSSIPQRFDEMHFAEDYLLWLTIAAGGGDIYFLGNNLACSFLDLSQSRLSNRMLSMQLGVNKVYTTLYRKGIISGSDMIKYQALSTLRLPIRYVVSIFKKVCNSI